MSITQNACGCGSTTTAGIASAEPCTCGCCGAPARAATAEERVAELRALRDSIDQELAELDHA